MNDTIDPTNPAAPALSVEFLTSTRRHDPKKREPGTDPALEKIDGGVWIIAVDGRRCIFQDEAVEAYLWRSLAARLRPVEKRDAGDGPQVDAGIGPIPRPSVAPTPLTP